MRSTGDSACSFTSYEREAGEGEKEDGRKRRGEGGGEGRDDKNKMIFLNAFSKTFTTYFNSFSFKSKLNQFITSVRIEEEIQFVSIEKTGIFHSTQTR